MVATLPDDEARAAAQSAPVRRPAPVPARSAPTVPAPGSTRPSNRTAGAAARPTNPSRHWVQIAGGANTAALPRELARLRALAPELADRNAWVTPANSTNRLLVGPFASSAEAQEFVNLLARRSVTAFVWKSDAGQEIARLQPGR
ncbi:MAG: SPOR domain-containing protein [Allosphingosinicella sp.]